MWKVVRRGLRDLLESLEERVLQTQHVQDPTAVHELRVASRRLSQNLRTFAPFVPKKISRKIRRKLRALRKVAGEVRNRDIVLEQALQAELPIASPLVDAIRQDREQARRLLQEALARWRRKDYPGRWRVKLRVPRCNKRSASRNIAELLPGLTGAFFAAGRKAAALDSPELLHEFRLAAKQFRYTLELLQDLYGPKLKGHLMAIRHIQDRLGKISDCATIRNLLRNYSGMDLSARAQLEQHLDRKLNESLASFQRYWRKSLDDPAQEAQWIRFVSNSQPSRSKR
jgi:CHAD domain-containing protein